MSRDLPANPSLEFLRKEAKEPLEDLRQDNAAAAARWSVIGSAPPPAKPKLADAQHAIAREYGFESWPKLRQHVQSLGPGAGALEALKDAILANDARRVAGTIKRHPALKSKLNDPVPGHAFGETPLLLAVQRPRREVIDALLDAGADINARSHWWAGSFGVLDNPMHPDRPAWLIPYLIERGAVVDAHAAAALPMLDRLKELVDSDPAGVHARGGDGQTPLHFAANVEIAEYLLEHGADIDAIDVDHESTPAQYMIRNRQDVSRYLVSRGCRTDVLMAAALGDIDLVRRHLDADPASIHLNVSETYFPMRNPRAGGPFTSGRSAATRSRTSSRGSSVMRTLCNFCWSAARPD